LGALTSKPYAFVARAWELESIDTIDVMDAVGSHLTFFVRDNSVVRVLPRLINNRFTNVEWITDKARFFYDALRRGRVVYPFIQFRGSFLRVRSVFFYNYLHKMFCVSQRKASVTFGLSPFIDVYAVLLLRDISFLLSKATFFLGHEETRINDEYNSNYIVNVDDVNLEKFDTFLCLYTNPRLEAPLLNLRLRGLSKKRRVYFLTLGVVVSQFINNINLGTSMLDFFKLITGKSFIALFLVQRSIMVLLGMHVYQRKDYQSVLMLLSIMQKRILSNNFLVNLLASKIATVGLCDVGNRKVVNFKVGVKEEYNWLFLLGYNAISVEPAKFTFIASCAHHGSDITAVSDVIVPVLTPYEQIGLFVNMEGRYIKTSKVLKKYSVYASTVIRFLWQFLRLNFFMLFVLRNYSKDKVNFGNESRYFVTSVCDIYTYFLYRFSFFLSNSKLKLIELPNFIAYTNFQDSLRLKIKLDCTLSVSYHRFYYSFDIFTSNSFNCLLAYKRFRSLVINY